MPEFSIVVLSPDYTYTRVVHKTILTKSSLWVYGLSEYSFFIVVYVAVPENRVLLTRP